MHGIPGIHRALDDRRNTEKRQSAGQKRGDRHFVGRVQDNGRDSPCSQRAVGQGQAWESGHVGSVELQRRGRRQIENRERRAPSIGIGQRVLNRQLHVGDAQLGDHRPIRQLDHRMHDRLRVHEHIDLVSGNAEQPARFDHLESLVHQGRRVNRDLVAHVPGRMPEGVVGPDPLQPLDRPVAKRPA